jgi:hypothetical protein
MKSSRRLTSLLFGAVVLLAPLVAFADKNDDLYNKGQAANNRGDAMAAQDAFCAIDPAFKDAAAMCTQAKQAAQTQINLHNKRFLDATQALQEGRLDDAERLFRSVKFGPRVDLAQKKIQEIADLKAKKAQQDAAANAAAANNAKVEQGVQAFNRGDFGTAKANLPSGHELLGKISQYEAKMAEGNRLMGAKDYAGAYAAFADARTIAPNGPGDPSGSAGRAQQAMSASAAPSNPPPSAPTKAAVRDEVKKIDEGSYIAQAQKLIGKKDYKRARRFLNDVIAQNFRNSEAADLLKSLPDEERTGTGPSEEDPILAAAINDFYSGNYSDANARLQNYVVQAKPAKPGLSQFYLGVIQATQYYLGGETNPNLLQEAKRRFKEAKGVEGFVPPEKYISPKIMRVYQAAG